MAILNYFRKNKLTEELHIEGLSFIGKGYGWELYQAVTFAGAEQLKAGDSDQGAGTAWCTPTEDARRSAEEVFNDFIVGQHIPMYFFVKEGTNKAFVAAILSGTSVLKFNDRVKIEVLNYQLQDDQGLDRNTNMSNLSFVLPLYLLPDIQYNGHDGLIIQDNNVMGTYNGFLNPDNIPSEVKLEDIATVKSYAFSNFIVPVVIIENTVNRIDSAAFKDYQGTIKLAAETPDDDQIANWSGSWNGNCQSIIYGIHLTPEEVARREEAERQRQEAERREREFQSAPAVNVLRYREVGNEITILGVKQRRKEIEIPEEINGKPVTKIAPFAFYENEELERVTIPQSVTEIGKAAFYGCRRCRIKYPRNAVVYKDAFLNCYDRSIY